MNLKLFFFSAAVIGTLFGCATTQTYQESESQKVAYLEESWGFYGLAIYFCDVLAIDGRIAPPPGWTNKRIDNFEISPGNHKVEILCDAGTYPRYGRTYNYLVEIDFQEGHRYKVDFSFLGNDCVWIKNLTTSQYVFRSSSCELQISETEEDCRARLKAQCKSTMVGENSQALCFREKYDIVCANTVGYGGPGASKGTQRVVNEKPNTQISSEHSLLGTWCMIGSIRNGGEYKRKKKLGSPFLFTKDKFYDPVTHVGDKAGLSFYHERCNSDYSNCTSKSVYSKRTAVCEYSLKSSTMFRRECKVKIPSGKEIRIDQDFTRCQ